MLTVFVWLVILLCVSRLLPFLSEQIGMSPSKVMKEKLFPHERFSAEKYLERMQKAALDRERRKWKPGPIELWFGFIGCRLNLDGTIEDIDREPKNEWASGGSGGCGYVTPTYTANMATWMSQGFIQTFQGQPILCDQMQGLRKMEREVASVCHEAVEAGQISALRQGVQALQDINEKMANLLVQEAQQQ